MHRAPALTARLDADVGGRVVSGFASDLLVPAWFRKESGRTAKQDAMGLAASVQRAGEVVLAAKEGSAFELWRRAWDTIVEAVPPGAPDRLERGFGVALVERCLIDAACRASGEPFLAALRGGTLDLELARLRPELASWDRKRGLPERLPERIAVRHTIGQLDPLRESEAGPSDDDGLPRSLEREIELYGLRHFKIKVKGERESDAARLAAIGRVLDERCPGGAVVTLDGNEQFRSLADLARLLDDVARHSPALAERIRFVEQPLPRALTFDRIANADMAHVRARVPVILDEADDALESFPRAFDLGYRGVSIKSCKGTFRALAARARCEMLGDGAFQSGEDLTTLPVLALQQDLALMGALGAPSVERNGHHYFRGLDHLPADEAWFARLTHRDLYEPFGDGVRLAIRGGEVAIGSLGCNGFAYDVPIRVDARTPIAQWSFAES